MLELLQIALLTVILTLLLKNYYGSAPRQKAGRNAVILDTSAIIDGRIVDITKAGFMPGVLVVPQFVVRELQLLADGNDSHKRERARFGLDVIARMQSELPKTIITTQTDFKDVKTTDDKLIKLAVKDSAYLCTSDFNLNKVANIEGVKVLNVNELAQAVRPEALPGEKYSVKIVQKGSNKDQGVGYLEDGTMVVVSGTGNAIGKHVDVSVTRMLQTEAGKMMFAKPITKVTRLKR